MAQKQTSIILTAEERQLLSRHFTKSNNASIRAKAKAVLLGGGGQFSMSQIAVVVEKSEKTVSRYLGGFLRRRMASVFSGHMGNENAAKLTKAQKQALETALAEPPSVYGLPGAFWDVPKVRSYMTASLDICYRSTESYRAVLRFCNYSFHRPATFDIKRNDELVKGRMAAIRQEIAPHLTDPDTLVFASDEVRIQEGCIVREAWCKRGEKTVVREHRSHTAQNYIGFLNLRTKTVDLHELTWQKNETITEALSAWAQRYPGKRLVVIWDGAPSHRGPFLREALKTGNTLQDLHLISMPPYAPDHNPIEQVWGQAKHNLRNTVFDSFKDMKAVFAAFITGQSFSNLTI